MAEWAFSLNTRSGGTVDLGIHNDRFYGIQAILHIDQSSNIANGQDEVSISINYNELKELQENIEKFLEVLEKTYNMKLSS